MSKEIKLDYNSKKAEIMEFLAAAEWDKSTDVFTNVGFCRNGVREETRISYTFENVKPSFVYEDNYWYIISKEESIA